MPDQPTPRPLTEIRTIARKALDALQAACE